MTTALARTKDAARFVFRTFIPTDEDFWVARQALKADLAWQPYLYAAVLAGAILSLLFGDDDTIPPYDSIDTAWMFFALVSPLAGFAASIMLSQGTGRVRYFAFWLRISAKIGIITALLCYQIAVIGVSHPLQQSLAGACVGFLLVLLVKDSRFLIATERVARHLRS